MKLGPWFLIGFIFNNICCRDPSKVLNYRTSLPEAGAKPSLSARQTEANTHSLGTRPSSWSLLSSAEGLSSSEVFLDWAKNLQLNAKVNNVQ